MLTGTCHCGAVTWRFEKDPTSATACNCTVCAKAGVLWIYGVEGEDVHVTGPTVRYVRKDGGALEFHHCPTCGNTISWRLAKPDDKGKTPSALNLRLTDTPDEVRHLPIRHFDGLRQFKALPEDGRTVKEMWF